MRIPLSLDSFTKGHGGGQRAPENGMRTLRRAMLARAAREFSPCP
jgi:hypothetical protein